MSCNIYWAAFQVVSLFYNNLASWFSLKSIHRQRATSWPSKVNRRSPGNVTWGRKYLKISLIREHGLHTHTPHGHVICAHIFENPEFRFADDIRGTQQGSAVNNQMNINWVFEKNYHLRRHLWHIMQKRFCIDRHLTQYKKLFVYFWDFATADKLLHADFCFL